MGAMQSANEICCANIDFSRDPSKKNIEACPLPHRKQLKTNKLTKGKIFRVLEENSLSQINSSLQLYSILGKGYLENSNKRNHKFKEIREVYQQTKQNNEISQPHFHKVISRKRNNLKSNNYVNQTVKQQHSFKLAISKLIEQQQQNNLLKIKPLSDSLPRINCYGLRSLSIVSSTHRIQTPRQNHSKSIKFSNENFMESNMNTQRTRSRHKSIFEQVKPKKSKEQQELTNHQSQRFSIKLENGDLFQGETSQDGVFQGEGIYTLSNGSVYRGVFKEGKAHGLGIYLSIDGFKYEGEWVDNSPHGYGKAHYNDGSTFTGYFKEGKKHGKGFFTQRKVTYDGDFVQDRMQGFGIYHSQTGQIYEGEWLNNMKHGKGVLKMSNGQVYEGQFRNNMKEGYGTMRYQNDSYYVGFWTKDKIDKRRRAKRASGDLDFQSLQKQIKKIL